MVHSQISCLWYSLWILLSTLLACTFNLRDFWRLKLTQSLVQYLFSVPWSTDKLFAFRTSFPRRSTNLPAVAWRAFYCQPSLCFVGCHALSSSSFSVKLCSTLTWPVKSIKLHLLRKTPSAASVPWAPWTLTCALWSSAWGAWVKDRCLHRAKKRKFLCIFRGAWTHLRVQVCSWETIPSRTVLGTHLEQWFVFSLDLSYEGWPGCPHWAARSLGKALRSPGNFFRNQG